MTHDSLSSLRYDPVMFEYFSYSRSHREVPSEPMPEVFLIEIRSFISNEPTISGVLELSRDLFDSITDFRIGQVRHVLDGDFDLKSHLLLTSKIN